MAILVSTPFLVIGPLEKREKILKKMQNLKCSQIEKLESLNNTQIKEKLKSLEKIKKDSETSIKLLLKYCVKNKKELRKLKDLTYFEENEEKIYETIKLILKYDEKIKILEKKIKDLELKKLKLENYSNLNIPLKNFKTKNLEVCFGEFNANFKEEELALKLKEFKDLIYFKIIYKNKQNTTIVLIYPKEIKEKLKETLKNINFNNVVQESSLPPKSEILNYEKKIKVLKDELNSTKEKTISYVKDLEKLKIFTDYLSLKMERFSAVEKVKETKNTFILTGFLNPKFEEKFKKTLTEKFNCYVDFLKKDENSPVIFYNNSFFSAAENITKTYSIPSSKDIDPTPIMSIFYYSFFGMMFSDAGYGLILTVFCAIFMMINKFKENKNVLKMFFFCGISTIFWGLMFGSFFGDSIKTISKTYFNSNLKLNPLWISTTEKPLQLLIFSLTFGVIQIIVGLLIKFYILIKQKNFKEAFFCVMNWVLILTGIGLFLVNVTVNLKLILFLSKCLIFLGLLITVFLSGYEAKGFMKILKGLINTYQITSYISDVLSYSRLMALGIATGVIADVVNILASMGGPNFFGIVLFILVFLIGHILNFSINVLGAYVHTNRLQYVEFFSKFYIGGGKLFKPFGSKTKYFS